MRTALMLSLITLLLLLLGGCSLAAAAKLEGEVKKALAAEAMLSTYSFEVAATEQGEVTITGKLWNEAEQARVAEVAAAVPGVTRVVNNTSIEEQGSSMMQDETVNLPF